MMPREPGVSHGQFSRYEQGSSEIGAAVLLSKQYFDTASIVRDACLQ